jgi:uncharacterized protein
MKQDYDAQHLNLDTFCRTNGQLSGSVALQATERLWHEAVGPQGAELVRFTAEGITRSDGGTGVQLWLQLSAQVALPMTCQRCLGSVVVDVTFDREFRFVATEDQAAQEDEESEEDVLAISRDFNLLELVEDELLMALPVVPTHDVCPQPVKLQVADKDFEATTEEKPNPFAVLEQLKKKPLA